MSDDLVFDVPFILGMMRLDERPEFDDVDTFADWLEARVDQGLHWFDHADSYGNHEGERRFGEALARRPALKSRVRVVTKGNIVLPSRDRSPFGVKHYDTSERYLTQVIDDSLTRLGVDRLDHFLLHRPDPLMDAEATARALDDAIDAGKVGAVGVSNFLPEQWRRLQAAMSHRLGVHQLELSLAHPDALFDGFYDAILADGLAPMAWSPLGGGSVFEDVLGTALSRLAEQLHSTTAGLAMAWLRRLPGRPIPVIGTLNERRIDNLLLSGNLEIDRPTWFALLEEARSHRVP
ncbi:aldo/keto reductase [Salinicola rhizosphaerae]|uniref:Aryl-alcohol dehydrogenase n=1 Tax=Salinicola rhizosphaerae TaxID=1443141 RepID=A0ABQ3DUZ2_9GAMM|nr:aldo/keto reductase [Salinicola rhizosphaerae]GHB16021.1 aryl-alcohol dehydrogenase [Salinicola rhizosphaerae]